MGWQPLVQLCLWGKCSGVTQLPFQSWKAGQIQSDLGANRFLPSRAENPQGSVQAWLEAHALQGHKASQWQNPHPGLRFLLKFPPILPCAVPGAAGQKQAVSLLSKWDHAAARQNPGIPQAGCRPAVTYSHQPL